MANRWLFRFLNLIAVAGFVALAAGHAHADAESSPMSCVRGSRGNDLLIAEVCDYSAQEYLVRVRTYSLFGKSSTHLKTEVNALYTKGEEIWNRVWVASGDGRFSAREQARLSRLAGEAPTIFVETKTLSFLSLISEFLTPDTALENFDAQTLPGASARVWGSNAAGKWTPICQYIGEARFAQYTLPNVENPFISLWIVGDPATQCKGRCGWGCEQTLPQHKKNQYTQECFNHDVCYTETGSLLGVCKDTFWMAAASYVFAPDCRR